MLNIKAFGLENQSMLQLYTAVLLHTSVNYTYGAAVVKNNQMTKTGLQ